MVQVRKTEKVSNALGRLVVFKRPFSYHIGTIIKIESDRFILSDGFILDKQYGVIDKKRDYVPAEPDYDVVDILDDVPNIDTILSDIKRLL